MRKLCLAFKGKALLNELQKMEVKLEDTGEKREELLKFI
jgi:hypothetical protein